jgi:hypothetical protein
MPESIVSNTPGGFVKPAGRWRGPRHEKGQAMVYGLFLIIGAVVALFFLFNTGQLSAEKTKLVNTGDAVAYSAGVMNARTLNYQAYTNRAMLANTVAIAQLVSLSSWAKHATLLGGAYSSGGGEDIIAQFSNVNWSKYPAYWPAVFVAQASSSLLEQLNERSGGIFGGDGKSPLESLAYASDQLVRVKLMTAQVTAHAGLIPARQVVMEQVAKANYINDGEVHVAQLSLVTGGDITGFVSRYSGNDRERFAEAAKTAANLDSFVPKRSWLMPALYPDKCSYMLDWLSRRGGTELIGFDEWKALDTLSEWRWKMTKSGKCVLSEHPVAYGGTQAADKSSSDADFSRYDQARIVNPAAGVLAQYSASSAAWGYSGLPSFYELSKSALQQEDPILRFAVHIRRPISETRTSEGRSEIRNSGADNRLAHGLNNFQAAPAGGQDLAAVSASEVFFERADDNVYGAKSGKPKEIGSLFNPYWQVRLAPADSEAHFVQALQGAFLP